MPWDGGLGRGVHGRPAVATYAECLQSHEPFVPTPLWNDRSPGKRPCVILGRRRLHLDLSPTGSHGLRTAASSVESRAQAKPRRRPPGFPNVFLALPEHRPALALEDAKFGRPGGNDVLKSHQRRFLSRCPPPQSRSRRDQLPPNNPARIARTNPEPMVPPAWNS